MLYGTPSRIRTWDPLLRRQMLYPSELMARCMVGVKGFEPSTFRSQSGRATKLRHTPL